MKASSPNPGTSDGSDAARQVAIRVVHALRDHGHIAYFAGGCVRDELLGLDPTDFDVATDAVPERLRAIFPRTSHVGASFGVVLVREHHVSVEVATFRSDGPYSDRRRPDHVHFSDPESDARRRDFTINAMFLDPLASGDARVIDFVGGRSDLAAKLVRAVGDPEARLREDHLRALRAVRFAARLGFTIEAATAEAIRRHAAELSGVSRERIGDELRRMLAHQSRATACAALNALGLDAAVLDERWREVQPRLLATLSSDAEPMLGLAAWLLDRANDNLDAAISAVRTARRTLCLSNDESAMVAGTLQVLKRLCEEWRTLDVAAQKRVAAHPRFAGALAILEGLDPAQATLVRASLTSFLSDGIGVSPVPLITGDDLISEGFLPDPRFKGILDRVYDAQLRGELSTKSTALELARRLRV